jgi:hypothetical protein
MVVDRTIKTHGLAMGRTLSLLLAIVCLSAPEFAQFFADHDSSEVRGSGEKAAEIGKPPASPGRAAFRSLPDCLKFARKTTIRALYQWALMESSAVAASPVIESRQLSDSTPRSPARPRVQHNLFQRPPPIHLS